MADEDSLAVWMQGQRAGTLVRSGAGVMMHYDQAYREGNGPALSVSLPKTKRSHESAVTTAWFDNLLPDNDEVRARWAAMSGTRYPSVFGILRYMGADCAGAVQVLPIGESPDTNLGQRSIDEAGIEARLRALRNDSADWNLEDTGGRWSLGGAQGKFALSMSSDGEWSVPTGRAASTHIFKVGPTVGANGVIAECLTSRIARLLGVAAARTDLCRFGAELAVVSERFDRRTDGSGVIRRLHQEDLCQAMGISRALKYQADGGPSPGDVDALFRAAVDPRDLQASREHFAKSVVFNWAIAGTDAHAKNFSLMHIGARVRLAPLYDLTSAAMMFDPENLHYHGKLAMKVGGEYRLRQIGVRNLRRAAAEIAVDPEWFVALAADFASRLPDAFEQAVEEISSVAETPASLRSRVGQRLKHVAEALESPAAPEHPTTDVDQSGNSDGVWVGPHTRGGRPILGHWRQRPGNR